MNAVARFFLFYIENSFEYNFNTPLICDVWGENELNGILVLYLYFISENKVLLNGENRLILIDHVF